MLDAVLDLFSEDNLSPGPEEVALRAGLSVRSVYRYFDDHDALDPGRHRPATSSGSSPLFLIPAIGEGTLDDRIDRFVDARLRLQAEAGPTVRAARIRATFDPLVRDRRSRRDRVLPAASRSSASSPRSCRPWRPDRARARLAAVDALSAFESARPLPRPPAAGPGEAGRLLADALRALLAD